MEEEKGALAGKLIELVNEISEISEFRCTVKKQYCNLARRLKLLTPMFEEIRDSSRDEVPESSISALVSLISSLESARDLLRFGSEGSKIYLVLEREQIMNEFQQVTAQIEQALSAISHENFDISDEVKEQVELVLSQFRRAKGRVDTSKDELYEDLLSLYDNNSDTAADPALLRRLVARLELTGIDDLMEESIALHEMVAATGGDPERRIEKMSMLLKKLKDFVQIDNPDIDSSNDNPSRRTGRESKEWCSKAPVVPNDFRCPISLELMRDPVIISTGQTYERTCIEKWLESGNTSCPKTQQPIIGTALTPNYALRSLIDQWCEANGIKPPKRVGNHQPSKKSSVCPTIAHLKIETLFCKLTSDNIEDQRTAAGEIRLLAKHNADSRVVIAEAGAVPLLVNLLSTPDAQTQEHAVTALLNLSIPEENKRRIMSSDAVPGIINALRKGSSMESRENAAATLFSLSVNDQNKITIGASGAIHPLVSMLSEGTDRGKRDAATALFNLCICHGNKGKAVRAGVVPILMQMLTEPRGTMLDEALAILAMLAGHSEGRAAMGSAEVVQVMVDFISNGNLRNRENAATVLVHLCSRDQKHLIEAQELSLIVPLLDLVQNGTERGRRKAIQLLEKMNRFVEQQKQALALTQALGQLSLSSSSTAAVDV